MRNHFIRPALLCAFALAAAACSGESANKTTQPGEQVAPSCAQTAAAADPCSFVSKEEVASATGEAVLQMKADGQTCTYETDDDASAVQVEIKQTGGAEEMGVARSASGVLGAIGNDMKNSGGAEGDTGEILTDSAAAPKIGDEAFFGANQQLHVLKGDTYFAVSPPMIRSRMSGGNPLLPSEKKREMAAAIAQKIANKL